jgi:hypothetical protein
MEVSTLLRVLRRIERRLEEASLVPYALEVSDLILRAEGVCIEPPLPEEDVLRLCRELEEDTAAQRSQDAVGAQALLIEIVKRAAFDWVLYRGSSRLEQKKIAEDAYTWLFTEEEDHPHWAVRVAEGKVVTSFLSICDVFDISPDVLRRKIRTLDPQRVLISGRPPNAGKEDAHGKEMYSHVEIPTMDVEEGFLSFL